MAEASRRSAAWLAALTGGALLWSALILLAPGALAAASRDGASSPRAVVAAATYLVASRVCHQRSERSFHLQGRSLPVCGRCTGLYLSATVGVLAGIAASRRAPSRRPRRPTRPAFMASRLRWLALAALPTALTWASEMVGLWDPGTLLRALAAVPLGFAAGVCIADRRA